MIIYQTDTDMFHAVEPYSKEGHKEISRQCKEAGWHLLYGSVAYEQHAWFLENKMLEVLRAPLLNEIWFKHEEDLMAYKLRWQ